MSNRKTTLFYALLIALASLAVGMVLASRLGLAPESSAQTVAAPPANSAPAIAEIDLDPPGIPSSLPTSSGIG